MAFPRAHHRHVLRVLPWLFVLPLLATRCATYSASGDEPDAFTPSPLPTSGNDSGTVVKDSGTGTKDAAVESDAGLGDAATADASDAAEPGQGFCATGQIEVGEFATWGGKVNVHKSTGGVWAVDSDCSSGSGVNTVTYCKKFWPSATALVHLAMVSSDSKPFTQGGGSAPTCGGLASHPGIDQFACCAFAP